ncbi:MAG: hypothetical protein ACOCTG_00805, partial [Bacteroidota bacterium]
MARLGTFRKRPDEEKDYDVDYSEWLTPTDGIAGEEDPDQRPEVEVEPDDLEIVAVEPNFDEHRVKIWIAGGSSGQRYTLTVTTRTREGRVKQDVFYLV